MATSTAKSAEIIDLNDDHSAEGDKDKGKNALKEEVMETKDDDGGDADIVIVEEDVRGAGSFRSQLFT